MLGGVAIPFHEDTDLLFLKTQTLPGHSNGMRYTAFDEAGGELYSAIFYSVGGGFVVREGEDAGKSELKLPPFPFSSADQLLEIGERQKLADLADHAGERKDVAQRRGDSQRHHSHMGGDAGMRAIADWKLKGILPGGLNVRRRAPRLARKLN